MSDEDQVKIAEEASLWLARRDRGLTAVEQDQYIQWLTSDPRHAKVLAQHASAFERMMQLYEWQPGPSAAVNPDLFAPPRPPAARWRRVFVSTAAAAAAILAAATWWWSVPAIHPEAQKTFIRVNERQALSDGSVVELKDGSQIIVNFTSAARRVTLAGEAHFTVAKGAVPFVVHAGNVAVQAVGTAFNVRAEQTVVDVLVTEGEVKVQRFAASGNTAAAASSAAEIAGVGGQPESSDATMAESVIAGQRVVVSGAPDAEFEVLPVTPAQIQAALAWKVPRLQFFETPLAVAVEEFNRRNRVRLVLEEKELRKIPIGGTFRIDNVDGFVRLLEATLEVRAVPQADNRILLTRGRAE